MVRLLWRLGKARVGAFEHAGAGGGGGKCEESDAHAHGLGEAGLVWNGWNPFLLFYEGMEEEKVVAIRDLLTAAGDGTFGEENIIGWGRFSTVYKALLADGTAVALKRLNLGSWTLSRVGFLKRLRILMSVEHPNLVRILGCDGRRKVMVLDYMPNSCLAKILCSGDSAVKKARVLAWDRRHKIALGVALGLQHLHCAYSPPLVHGDLKPSCVFLDVDAGASVSNFGMLQLMEENLSEDAEPAAAFVRTTGYTAPERAVMRPSPKQDVYSFGILVLELLTGQVPDSSVFGRGVTISEWVDRALSSRCWQRIMDPQCLVAGQDAKAESNLSEMKAMLKLGVWCSQKLPVARPDMQTVTKVIRQIRNPVPCVTDNGVETDGLLVEEAAAKENATIRSLMLRRVQSSARVFK